MKINMYVFVDGKSRVNRETYRSRSHDKYTEKMFDLRKKEKEKKRLCRRHI